ncbi:MAG: S1-like domain-containing RNA-binding protein [Flavobacteriales bacterium]|nr:S1-like domain-containing RNA-binding protein [Flavobacteriales bacterium]
MIEIGKYNKLKILRQTSVGLYLGDGSDEDVLLPIKYCPEEFEIDDELEVFIYRDYAERKIATNLVPKVLLNEFAFLKVHEVSRVGAFLDWGLEKGLLVPFSEQRQNMEKDRWYVVFMAIDEQTDRLYASNKINKLLQNDNLTVKEGDKVNLLVTQETDLGYSVIVNNIHRGLIYNNEVFQDLNVGDKLDGFVKKIREENKLDISIQQQGYRNFIDKNCETIYHFLKDNEGIAYINDKSSPDEIYDTFKMSKKSFKKAIGSLYKQKVIVINSKDIRIKTT